jgi:hypothetical protein
MFHGTFNRNQMLVHAHAVREFDLGDMESASLEIIKKHCKPGECDLTKKYFTKI